MSAFKTTNVRGNMPHIIIKIFPGKTEEQKQSLTQKISESIQDILGNSEDSISIDIEEIRSSEWKEKVYDREIAPHIDTLYKAPGYKM